LNGDWKRVDAFGKTTGRRNVLHLMNRERIGQRRGVPFLAPIIEPLKQLGRYQQAEIDAAVINALWAVFIEKGENSGDGAPMGSVVPEGEQVDAADPASIEISSGTIVDLEYGEKANLVTPGRPNPNFDSFVTAFTRHIGTALEIPYEVLIKHFDRSYSASRAALLELFKSVKMFRSWFASDFCQSVFEEFLAEAVAKGRVTAQGFFSDPAIRKAYSGAQWNGPAQGLLNPVHEVRAAEMRVACGFSTRDREAQEMNGSDFYKNANDLKHEEMLMREIKSFSDT
jgi:lambda family phage portal protein